MWNYFLELYESYVRTTTAPSLLKLQTTAVKHVVKYISSLHKKTYSIAHHHVPVNIENNANMINSLLLRVMIITETGVVMEENPLTHLRIPHR